MRVAKKKLIMIGIVGLGIIIITGILLSKTNKDKAVIKLDNKKITIGFCVDNLVIERWKRDQEIFKTKAMEQDLEVLIYNANEDNEIQNEQIRALIKKKVDVIVVVPYDKNGLTESIKEAKKQGIKVIAYDRLIRNADIDAYISFDNLKVGQLQAEALVEVVPNGNYVIINGSPEDNNSSMFHEGYMNVLSHSISAGDIQIVEEIWAGDWREEPAYDAIVEVIGQGKSIDAIIGANDRLAEAAIRALSEKGLAGNVYVAGHDANISACQRIIEGTQYVTVYKPIKLLAESAVELAVQLVRGESLETEETIHNGSLNIPYIKLDVLSVTKETMEATVIADGFHDRDAVFRD